MTSMHKYKVLAIIITSIKDDIIPYVVDMEDPWICWKALQELFEIHNVACSIYLINKLLSIRMDETSLKIVFLKEIKEITTQLTNIGKPLEESKGVQMTLNALPKSFEGFIQVVVDGNQM
jgi:hypothetical protein